jgi:hypothetical protein
MIEQTTGAYAPQTGTIHVNELPEGASIVAFGHRSGAETHQACPRCYYLNYLYLGRGITPAPGPLYFAVGTAVHHGLANMLLGNDIDASINAALDSLCNSPTYIALEINNELNAFECSNDTQLEQRVLVEGLLYAFSVYALPGLLNDFEVLCVETGAVEYVPIAADCPTCNGMSVGTEESGTCPTCSNTGVCMQYIAIQSRPDAILRNRKTHEVCGISWKTIDDPSDLRRSQLVNDLQGYMEMYYGERILEKLAGAPVSVQDVQEVEAIINDALTAIKGGSLLATLPDFIHDLQQLEERARAARNIPAQIDYIQTIFLVKGPRRLVDEDNLAESLARSVSGFETQDEYGGYQAGKQYRQMSHMCYRYRNPACEAPIVELYKSGPNKGKPKPINVSDPNYFEESWAYRFYKPGNETGSALSPKWLTSPIQPDQIRDWVDRLNRGEVYPSNLSDERNPHPLAKVIRFEEPLYKDAARAASHVRQQHNRFIGIARAKHELTNRFDSGSDIEAWTEEKMDILDELFPQQLISCRTPYKCVYHSFCHGAELTQIDFQSVPPGFELRTPHHAEEREYFASCDWEAIDRANAERERGKR